MSFKDLKPNIALILLGGTISMTPDKNDTQENGGVTPTLSAKDLCNAIPGIDQYANLETFTPKMIASANLSFPDVFMLKEEIGKLVNEKDCKGVVIVQGTDTMEETAFLLDLVLDTNVPVIFTGAMRSADMVSADGPANILSSVISAAQLNGSEYGVMVLMNDVLHAARYVQKCHTRDVSAFRSLNGGTIGQVCEGKILLNNQITTFNRFKISDIEEIPKVALLKASLGDDGALLNNILNSNAFDGLVIEAFGAGHLPESWLPYLDKISKRIPVMLCSRTMEGPVLENTYGYVGAEIDLIKRGLIPAGILDGPKARLYMMVSLITDNVVKKPTIS